MISWLNLDEFGLGDGSGFHPRPTPYLCDAMEWYEHDEWHLLKWCIECQLDTLIYVLLGRTWGPSKRCLLGRTEWLSVKDFVSSDIGLWMIGLSVKWTRLSVLSRKSCSLKKNLLCVPSDCSIVFGSISCLVGATFGTYWCLDGLSGVMVGLSMKLWIRNYNFRTKCGFNGLSISVNGLTMSWWWSPESWIKKIARRFRGTVCWLGWTSHKVDNL